MKNRMRRAWPYDRSSVLPSMTAFAGVTGGGPRSARRRRASSRPARSSLQTMGAPKRGSLGEAHGSTFHRESVSAPRIAYIRAKTTAI